MVRTIKIAMADLRQGDTHLLQHRNHDPSKAAAGLIGFFGGQLEAGESSEEAVSREIGEETSLQPSPEDFEHVGPFETIMERDGEELKIVGEFFRHEVPPGVEVTAKEGDIVQIPANQLKAQIDKMSPATVQAIKQYMNGEK
jgi:8-oxo-dGTP pyrophosphatase MutT (NUDIX family)